MPDPMALKPWFDLIVSYGVPLIITIGVLWLAKKYIPQWIDGTIESQRQIPTAINGLTETLREGVTLIKSVKEDSKTARSDLDDIKTAVHHAAAAAEMIVKLPAISQQIGTGAAIEFRKAKNAVEDEGHREYRRRSGDTE